MSATIAPESSAATSGATPGAPPAAKKFNPRILIALVLVAGAATWAIRNWYDARTHETTENAQVDGHIVPVAAKVGGFVKLVSVAENVRGVEGSVGVTLDDAEYRVRLAQAEADLRAALAAAGNGANVGQAAAALQSANSQRAVTDAQIDAARASYDKAQSDLTRLSELAARGIVSAQQLDAARAAEASTKASLVAIQRQSAAVGANITGAQAGERFANARLAAAQAARDNAALQLAFTRVTLPVSGIVARKQIEPGQLVQSGQSLFSMVADTGLWVTANFKETQLDRLRVGQQAELIVDAYAGCIAKGVVESVSPATGARFALLPPDNATGNFTKVVQRVPVRISVKSGCGEGKALRPGMSVEARVTVSGS